MASSVIECSGVSRVSLSGNRAITHPTRGCSHKLRGGVVRNRCLSKPLLELSVTSYRRGSVPYVLCVFAVGCLVFPAYSADVRVREERGDHLGRVLRDNLMINDVWDRAAAVSVTARGETEKPQGNKPLNHEQGFWNPLRSSAAMAAAVGVLVSAQLTPFAAHAEPFTELISGKD
eukprot:1185056-Prorocentrum_minimum.AAC.3